jgi:hypothetical protein
MQSSFSSHLVYQFLFHHYTVGVFFCFCFYTAVLLQVPGVSQLMKKLLCKTWIHHPSMTTTELLLCLELPSTSDLLCLFIFIQLLVGSLVIRLTQNTDFYSRLGLLNGTNKTGAPPSTPNPVPGLNRFWAM